MTGYQSDKSCFWMLLGGVSVTDFTPVGHIAMLSVCSYVAHPSALRNVRWADWREVDQRFRQLAVTATTHGNF